MDRDFVLDIQPDAYALRLDASLLARLEGGAAVLMPAPAQRLREIDMEGAIERAEEWLMPSSRLFQGLSLRVHDPRGRLRPLLGAGCSLTTEDVEQVFNSTHRALARTPLDERDAVAGLVLLRELAHHGRLSGIVIERSGLGEQPG